METAKKQDAQPQKLSPNDKAFLSVPCVVLGLGHIAGVTATKDQLRSNYAQGWNSFTTVDYPRDLKQDLGVGSSTGLKEGTSAYLRVASPKQGDRSVGLTTSGASLQDGGNGSGGDAANTDYNADMIESRLGFTFWKRETGGAQTALASDSNVNIAGIYAANFDPGFARLFTSHSDAMAFLAKDGQFLHNLFQYVLVVAVKAEAVNFESFCKGDKF